MRTHHPVGDVKAFVGEPLGADPAEDPLFLEARHITAARDFQVGTDDGTRSARELLDEAEAAHADALVVAACLREFAQ